MPNYYPEDQSRKNLLKIMRTSVCAECGRQLLIYLDISNKRKYIACSGQIHEGITREYKAPTEDYESNIRREVNMEKEHGTTTATALAKLPSSGALTRPEAMEILKLVYPDVPENEIIRCAILCRDFGLHPLMKEVYIIPFGQGDKRTWATVLGINATRKLMAQRGTFSYLDNTPRVMKDEEQMTIFGEIDEENIVAITKLRTREGEEAQGYGRWPKDKQPYGTDKGNTKANMSFIRSERNAFGRLFTDAIPQGVEIVDEAYVEVPGVGKVAKATGEIVDGEVVSETDEEKPDPLVEPEPEDEGQSTSLIDIDWLKESMKALQAKGQKAYSDESMLTYMRSIYKGVEGDTVYSIASKLDKGMANHFTKVIQDALDKP